MRYKEKNNNSQYGNRKHGTLKENNFKRSYNDDSIIIEKICTCCEICLSADDASDGLEQENSVNKKE